MFTLRRPAVYVPLVLTVVAVLVGGFSLLSRSGGGNLLSAGRPNCPPVARNDAALTPPNQPVTIDVLSNDTDVDGDHLQFQVIDVSAGSAEVDFKGANAQRLVYTPSTPDGTTAKVKYRVVDPSGDVSTAVVTVAISQSGVMPAGLASASVGDPNGEAIETRCLKVAKGGPSTTRSTTAITTPLADTPDEVVYDEFGSDTTAKKSATTPHTTTTRGPKNTGDSPSPSTDGTTPPHPATTQPPTTSPPTTSPSASPCGVPGKPSCEDWANGDDP
jgi:hypothetical protein